MIQLQRIEPVPSNGAKNLFEFQDIKYIFYLVCKMLYMKNWFGLDHYKCTGHTSNTMDFKSRYHSYEDQ